MAQRTEKKQQKQALPLLPQGQPTVYDQDNDTDYATRRPQKPHRKKGGADVLYTLAIVLFAVIFVASAGMLLKRWLDDRRTENEFDDLQTLISTEAPAEQTPDAPAGNAVKFAALLDRNPDFVGWISIDGTNLDFPVVQRPADKNYYLKHDFNGNYSDYGVPYLDEKCTFAGEQPSNNLIVYGHNMKTGTIFGCLTNYKKAEYYTQHPTIEFDTLSGDNTYTVFAAFAIDVVQDQSFLYNEYTDMDEETFNSFVAEVKRRSDVDSGYTPAYGDALLTLSTCEYSTSNGRYAVCAYKTPQ